MGWFVVLATMACGSGDETVTPGSSSSGDPETSGSTAPIESSGPNESSGPETSGAPESSSSSDTGGTTAAADEESSTTEAPTSSEASSSDSGSDSSSDSGSSSTSDDTSLETSATTGVIDGCGDGNIDFGEECDGDAMSGLECEDFGLPDGDLACDVDCVFDLSDCVEPVGPCGDGDIDPGEQCDGENLQGFDCFSLGLGGGTLLCDDDFCFFDTAMCMG